MNPDSDPLPPVPTTDVAIVGMAAHLPGAKDVRKFWQNLRDGVESMRDLSEEELEKAGVLASSYQRPNYVRRAVVLDEMEHFDAGFFGFSPKDAAITDPQHRHFLETCWEALEDAGHTPSGFGRPIGVFGGSGMTAYMSFNVLSNPKLVDEVGIFLLRHTGNDKDFLTTRVSYELDLRGPSVNVQTACSTSLVAVHLAVQSLLSGECDMALAGGATILLPHGRGYLYHENEVLSPDGRCRPFDASSNGTVFGSGSAVVVLRRLEDALAEGDHIYAVIKGTAINNDGAQKVGYLAPSVDGQARAVAEALTIAGTSAETIGYIEAHGTATKVGDPIEVAALTQAFRGSTTRTGFCGLGSVKSNIGHLDTAAGVASLIKVSLALANEELPPSLHYRAPNPEIDFAASPFYVNGTRKPWRRGAEPRRAGVNSLGVGGTNAFAILEEAPLTASEPARRPAQLLCLSARSASALDAASARLRAHLAEHPELALADVAWTLQVGREGFDFRRSLVARDVREACELLERAPRERVHSAKAELASPSLVFLLPGAGAQYVSMGRGLYEHEPTYRRHLDACFELFEAELAAKLRRLLLATPSSPDERKAWAKELERPSVQLPALFATEYALAQLWISFGLAPAALVGHSMGENTAACLAGVMTLQDALDLVALRGRLVESVAPGGMLSVNLAPEALRELLGSELSLAVINGPELCVASGPREAIDSLEQTLREREIDFKRIHIDIAGHSAMLEPILADFRAYLRSIPLSAPQIPFVSNRTGTWITAEQATDPEYWVAHLRGTVHFSACIRTLLEDGSRLLLEVGPGNTLASLTRLHGDPSLARRVLSSLRHHDEDVDDLEFTLGVLGKLWCAGAAPDWRAVQGEELRLRVPLPGYPFERTRYWIEPGRRAQATEEDSAELTRESDLSRWFHVPRWSPVELDANATSAERSRWLLFLDEGGVGEALAEELVTAGHSVVRVYPGARFEKTGEREYNVSPIEPEDYAALLAELSDAELYPQRIVHCWMVTEREDTAVTTTFFHWVQEHGFYSLLYLAQALSSAPPSEPLHLAVVSNGMQRVSDEALPHPVKACVLGPVKVIPREIASISATSVDLDWPTDLRARSAKRKTLLASATNQLRRELASARPGAIVAWRGGQRFERGLAPHPLQNATSAAGSMPFREGGTYLITGGLGGIGLALAEELTRKTRLRLVLVGRQSLPERSEWTRWIAAHGADEPTALRLRKLLALEAAGAEVMAGAADIANPEELRALLGEVHARFGAIHGVIHAAGIVEDGVISAKTAASVDRVFTPKIQGTLQLDELLSQEPLDFFVLFSSTSAWFGPLGQIDYAAANAFLDAFAQHRSAKRDQRTVAIGWGTWSDVGMAARLVAPTATHEHGSGGGATSAATEDHPLLGRCIVRDEREIAYSARLSPRTHWILGEHRLADGTALVPGTGYLEMLRAASELDAERRGELEIRDLSFVAPLVVPDDGERTVLVRLVQEDADWRCEVASRASDGGADDEWVVHAQGKLRPANGPKNTTSTLEALRARCPHSDRAALDAQRRELRFGPRWDVVRDLRFGAGEALAELELPAAWRSDLETHVLHPALLDLATGFALRLLPGYGEQGVFFAPLGYARVRVHGPLPARITSHARLSARRPANDDLALFDLRIYDEAGELLLEIDEFALRRFAGSAALSHRSPAHTNAARQARGERSAHVDATLQRFVELGIRSREGAEALGRVLASSEVGPILVSSIPVDALARAIDAQGSEQNTAPSSTFARPELATDFVPPRDELEKGLAKIWQELLGVEQVGIHDDFFALGGYSLIAVRLFARVKKAWKVDFPLAMLFEAPTVESLALRLREELGEETPATTAEGGATAAAPSKRRKFKHLVPLGAPTKSEGRPPFFLVAGMYGNVMNLRHLAGHLGSEQQVFGIQARGVEGDDEPDETFEAMAERYLAEVREVQPHGPYLLGGYSGGGIAAFEMAQQLRAAGEDVALLVFLDSRTPLEPPLTPRKRVRLAGLRLRKHGVSFFTTALTRKFRQTRNQVRDLFLKPLIKLRPADYRTERIGAAFCRALPRYRLRPYPGRVALFRPPQAEAYVLGEGHVVNEAASWVEPRNGWGPWIEGGIDLHMVTGDHDNMVLEPNVRVLARKLREALDQAIPRA